MHVKHISVIYGLHHIIWLSEKALENEAGDCRFTVADINSHYKTVVTYVK